MTITVTKDLVRDALRDRRLWAELASSETTRGAVLEELDRLMADVGAQMNARASEMSALKVDAESGIVSQATVAERRREYATWHSSATRFRSLISDRAHEIRPLVSDTHRRLSDQANRHRELVITLAKGIYRHQSEQIGDADLYALLEELTISDGLAGEISLFALATRILGEHTAVAS